MKNKILILFIFGMFLLSLNFTSATQQTLGTFKQGQQVNLIQTCATCTFNNISLLIAPDGTTLISSNIMSKDGTTFSYLLNGTYTTQIGTYKVMGLGDLDGTNTIWNYTFEIKGGTLGFFIIAFVLFFGLTFYGLKIENEWIGLIGCFGLLMLGLFISFNGIDLYKNNLTTAIAYITIAIGLGIGFEALYKITYF